MTDLPEMTPSAEDRARMALNQCEGVLLSKPAAALLIAREAEAAFYEGALAERERIVAWLREGDETFLRNLADSIRATAMALDGVATSDDYAVIAVGALADRIAAEERG